LVQRAHSALLLVLGNVLLAAVTFLLSFLVTVINPDWWLVLIGAGLILICVFVSTLFALLAGANLQTGGGSPAPEAGLFFRSGQTLPLSAAQFSARFHRATRQQLLEGALGELYTHKRRRAWQEHWVRWAMLAYVLALSLFTLATVVLLVLLVW
jgi:hypothetical protein